MRVAPRARALYAFRRLRVRSWPECSYLVTRSFSKAGYTFGVAPDEAQPDDIADFAAARCDRYGWPVGPAVLPLPR